MVEVEMKSQSKCRLKPVKLSHEDEIKVLKNQKDEESDDLLHLEDESRYVMTYLLKMMRFGRCIKKQKLIFGQLKNLIYQKI